MKSAKILAVLVLAVGCCSLSNAAPMGTAWTYQGRLIDTNDPADGIYDFEFKLFDAPNGGVQEGNTIDINDVDVIDGYFKVELDFGSDVFDGNVRWLEIGVRHGGSIRNHTALSPRQKVTPTPYALQTRGIFVDDNGNVSIGGTDPWYALDVYKVVSDSWIAGFHNLGTGDMDGGIIVRAFGGDPLLVQAATANVLNVKQNGNVGIGTTDPQQNLSIQATRPQIALAENGGDTGVVEFHEETNQLRLQYWSDYGATWMRDMMVLDGITGKVGIGTRDPDSRLDIKAASGYSDGGLRITSSINNNQVITLQDATPGDQGQITVKEGGSNKIVLRANGDTYLNGGNVGIGTASPAAKLDVVGTDANAMISATNNSTSNYSVAVYGENYNGNYGSIGGFWYGVLGSNSGGGVGVDGDSDSGNGVRGLSNSGDGVRGSSQSGYGVFGQSATSYGVYGNSFSSYAGYFNGDVFVLFDCSAESFTDRTPYPPDLATAYEAVMSMERLPDGQYEENDKQVQLDHSKLSDFIKSKDGNRDLSATVSCHNEVLKHLIRKNDELEKAYVYIEQLNKRIIALEAKLVKMEGIICNLQ